MSPFWLSVFTGLAIMLAIAGGVSLLVWMRTVGYSGQQDLLQTFLGMVALLVTFLFPASLAIRYYLHLENPITIYRSSIREIHAKGSMLVLWATRGNSARIIRLAFNTRSPEEAKSIRSNLAVRAHGRLRVYPITFLPKKFITADTFDGEELLARLTS
ncbi:MAG TPA: hypothetical protein VGL77_21335 [Armatimonadota bacterium]